MIRPIRLTEGVNDSFRLYEALKEVIKNRESDNSGLSRQV